MKTVKFAQMDTKRDLVPMCGNMEMAHALKNQIGQLLSQRAKYDNITRVKYDKTIDTLYAEWDGMRRMMLECSMKNKK